MGRNFGAAAAGVFVVGLVVMGLQAVGSFIYPLPADLDPSAPGDSAAFSAHLASMPFMAWALAFASELIGASLGALTAGLIAQSHRKWFAGGIVSLAVVGSVMNWMSFPHPLWFIVGQLVAYPLVFVIVTGFLPAAGISLSGAPLEDQQVR